MQKKTRKKLSTKQIVILAIMIPIIIAAIIFACWPMINGFFLDRAQKDAVQTFWKNNPSVSSQLLVGKVEETPRPFLDLYEAMVQYNLDIYENKQENLGDAWSYNGSDFDLMSFGVESEVVGVVDIPSLDISMPLYLGASYDHMAAGCTQLAATSMPIGGINTNCVIAGHCGWGGASYFRYLSTIEEGAYVYVTNLWETMVYKVVETKIILPYDLDEILIQEGKDMITLFTCHPYASGGLYRFVVYCERVPDSELEPIVVDRTEKEEKQSVLID